jgi:hypothetical protein
MWLFEMKVHDFNPWMHKIELYVESRLIPAGLDYEYACTGDIYRRLLIWAEPIESADKTSLIAALHEH